MTHATILLSFFMMAALFATVHAQEAASGAVSSESAPETIADEKETTIDAGEKTISVDEEKVENDSAAESETIDSPVAADTAEPLPAAPERTERHSRAQAADPAPIEPCSVDGANCQPVSPTSGGTDPCLANDSAFCQPVPVDPCLANDSTFCLPVPVDPCLENDSAFCQPTPDDAAPEDDDSTSTEGALLFSFNPLWTRAKAMPSNPNAGTLVPSSPVLPAELTEIGPDPKIIGMADGRSTSEVDLPSPLTSENQPASIMGLFSSANLPWLGLIFLLVFGLLIWHRQKN